jgi:RNA polymerase sigma factor (sigma-70 family)
MMPPGRGRGAELAGDLPMAESSEADRYLIDQIARGNTDAWSQLVNRYHGRMLAFARARLPRHAAAGASAEDFVQETFLRFLQSFRTYRLESSLETFLFTILRRRMIDHFRGRRLATCAIQDAPGAVDDVAHAPSWYVRRDEQTDLLEEAVAAGLKGVVRRLREEEMLDELRVIEMVFYAQMRNKDIAQLCSIDEKRVSQVKFQALAQIRKHLAAALTPDQGSALQQMRWEDVEAADSVLTRVWEALRPTCPKRSTIGRFILGTLDSPWREYVDFHVHQLGCRFCQANMEDVRRESQAQAEPLRQRTFQSTVGFLPSAVEQAK